MLVPNSNTAAATTKTMKEIASETLRTTDDTKNALAKLGVVQGWVGQAKGVKEVPVCGRQGKYCIARNAQLC